MSETVDPDEPATPAPAARRRRARALTVTGAVATAVLIWLATAVLGGVDLEVQLDHSVHTVGIGAVVIAAALASLSGWALLVILERTTRHPRRTWTILAVALATLSLTPSLTSGVTTDAALSLALMHLGPAAVVIPLLPRGSGVEEALRRDVERGRSEDGQQVVRLEQEGGVEA